MDSITVRSSILTERRHIRDTYCPQEYQNGDQLSADQQPRPSIIQKYIQYRDNSNTEVVNSGTPIRANETSKESRPLSLNVSQYK